MRYADPTLCPDCRGDLPRDIRVCPTCGLLVRHSLAAELFATLTRADDLVARLRSASQVGTSPGPSPGPSPTADIAQGVGTAPAAPLPPLPTYPSVSPASAGAPGPVGAVTMRTSSVPKVLLGLGALCLLVAAVTFLAVTWDRLGVGGRTAVLVGLTVSSAAAVLALQRAGLRVAAESLSVVALGLLALDVLGAGAAGWLGDADGGAVVLVCGLTLAAGAAGMSAIRAAERPRLVAPQVLTGAALVLAWVGASIVTGHVLVPAHLTALGCLAGVVAARSLRMPPLAWSMTAAAATTAATAALTALGRALDTPTLEELWVDGSGWSLLLTAATLATAGRLAGGRAVATAGTTAGALCATVALTVPVLDEGPDALAAVSLLATAAWAGVLALGTRELRTVAALPAAAGATLLAGQLAAGVVVAAARWAEVADRGGRGLVTRLDDPAPWAAPWALGPAAALLVTVVVLLPPWGASTRLRAAWPAVAVAGALGGVTTLASYDVRLVWVVAALSATSVGVALPAARRTGTSAAALTAVAAGTSLAACAAGMVDGLLLTPAACVASAVAVALATTARTGLARALGGVALAPALAALVAGGVQLGDGGTPVYAVCSLVVLGVACVLLPRPEVELPAVALTLLALAVAVSEAGAPADLVALWLALAGGLTAATGLAHPGRRGVALATPALWLLAGWTWLAARGVETPEAYTLPAAAGLLLVGLVGLRRDARAGTLTHLAPGLLLATVPSLLWVLEDPASLRALLLGAACLAMTLAGAALRWSGPLVVGAGVGAVLVLRELAPYAGAAPQWVWIGLAGTLLTVVGVTWERRLLEVRRAVGALGRLR